MSYLKICLAFYNLGNSKIVIEFVNPYFFGPPCSHRHRTSSPRTSRDICSSFKTLLIKKDNTFSDTIAVYFIPRNIFQPSFQKCLFQNVLYKLQELHNSFHTNFILIIYMTCKIRVNNNSC